MNTTVRLLTLALFISSALVLTECRKASEPMPAKPSEREVFLTTPGWNIKSWIQMITTSAGVVTSTDILPSFDTCFFDDLNHYNADHTFTIDEGPVKCGITYPSGASWDFASNETEIVSRPRQAGEIPTQIVTLTASTLVLSDTNTTSNGDKVINIKTYSAK